MGQDATSLATPIFSEPDMAILFDCPHCKEPYKLKDDRRSEGDVQNPDCRMQITIQSAVRGRTRPRRCRAAEETQKQVEKPRPAEKASGDLQLLRAQLDRADVEGREEHTLSKSRMPPAFACRNRKSISRTTGGNRTPSSEPCQAGPTASRRRAGRRRGEGRLRRVASRSRRAGIEYEPRPLKRTLMFVAARSRALWRHRIRHLLSRHAQHGERRRPVVGRGRKRVRRQLEGTGTD